jgi:hypothetical protein
MTTLLTLRFHNATIFDSLHFKADGTLELTWAHLAASFCSQYVLEKRQQFSAAVFSEAGKRFAGACLFAIWWLCFSSTFLLAIAMVINKL